MCKWKKVFGTQYVEISANEVNLELITEFSHLGPGIGSWVQMKQGDEAPLAKYPEHKALKVGENSWHAPKPLWASSCFSVAYSEFLESLQSWWQRNLRKCECMLPWCLLVKGKKPPSGSRTPPLYQAHPLVSHRPTAGRFLRLCHPLTLSVGFDTSSPSWDTTWLPSGHIDRQFHIYSIN